MDLYAGVRGRRTSMKMVDPEGEPLGRQYYSDEHEDPLTPDDLVRGYQTEDGRMIVVTDEELDAIAPEMSRDIELRRFVPRDAIPPAYYDRPYFLAPSGKSSKAYTLLAQVMESTGRVGIGTFVMRGKQYLVAILSDGNVLRAETLRFAGEIRTPDDIGLPKPDKADAKEVKRFAEAIDELTRDRLDMDELSDQYAKAIQALVEQKAKKDKDVVAAPGAAPEEEEEAGGEVIDLMQLLKERVGRASKAPARRAASSDLNDLSKQALLDRAKDLRIAGRSKMGKRELIDAIRKAG